MAKPQGNITTTEVAHGGKAIALLKGLAWTLVALGLVVILENFVRVPPGRDSSAFLYVGKGILQGEIPYLDRWDHKGPLLYLLNAAGLLISGAKGVWGLWAMEMAILLGTVFCACKTFTRAFNMSSLVAMLIIVYFFHWSLQFDLGRNFTEFYALLFQFLSIYIFYNKSKLNSRLADRSSLIIGALGGCAFFAAAQSGWPVAGHRHLLDCQEVDQKHRHGKCGRIGNTIYCPDCLRAGWWVR